MPQNFPVGVLKADSPLCAIWPVRLVRLKTVKPVAQWHDDGQVSGWVHVVDLADAAPEMLACVASVIPGAPAAALLARVREVAVAAEDFEVIV